MAIAEGVAAPRCSLPSPLAVTLDVGALALVLLLNVADGWLEALTTAVGTASLTMIVATAFELVLLGCDGAEPWPRGFTNTCSPR